MKLDKRNLKYFIIVFIYLSPYEVQFFSECIEELRKM